MKEALYLKLQLLTSKLFAIILVLILIVAGYQGRYYIWKAAGKLGIVEYSYYRMKVSMFEHEKTNKNGIVFLGDSLTDYVNFEDYFPFPVFNRGIAGDTTSGVLNRIDDIIELKPAKLFLLIGTNDIGSGVSTDKILTNVQKIISAIQENSSDTKIYIQSLFPTNNSKFKSGRPIKTIKEVNAKLEELAKSTKCEFIDLYPLLTTFNGELDEIYTLDGLHLNARAIAIWMKFIAPYVNE